MNQQSATVVKATGFRTVRTPAGRVLTPKLTVTQADLDMYGIIVGRTVTPEEQLHALELPEPNGGDTDGGAESSGAYALEQRGSVRAGNWSPIVLCAHLRNFCAVGISMTINRPQLTAWARAFSTEARKRLSESHARLR